MPPAWPPKYHGRMHILVAGASVGGLSAALALARSGHRITLVERDEFHADRDAISAFEWKRDGIPHFQQPHAFLPRGRLILQRNFPDVYEALLNAGAIEFDCAGIVPGPRQAGDEELTTLAVRRPLIEWALRNAVARERDVQVLPNAKITGLAGKNGAVPHIEGIRLADGRQISGDLVIDALGRTSPAPSWIESLGAAAPSIESSSCGLIYYSRYLRLLPGKNLPVGKWLTCFGPRGDLGYAMYASFVGDNRTFALVLGIPNWDADLRLLKNDVAFTAACRTVPSLEAWVADSFAEPITPVMPMGALENTIRDYQPNGSPCVTGLLPAADAVCHTDPAFGFGVSFAFVHALELAAALAENPADPYALAHSYLARITPEIRERFDMSRTLDDARNEMWKGVKLDFTKPSGCYPMFVAIAAGTVALRDPEVCRKWLRRITMLDRSSVLDNDVNLQQRIETSFASMMKAAPPAKPGPDRQTFLATVRDAAQATVAQE